MVSVVLRFCWFPCFKVEETFPEFIGCHNPPQNPHSPRYLLSMLDWENCPVCSALHPLPWYLMSYAGLNELAVMSPICIWVYCPLHRHHQLRRASLHTNFPPLDCISFDFPHGHDLSPVIYLGSFPRIFAWSFLRLLYASYKSKESGLVCYLHKLLYIMVNATAWSVPPSNPTSYMNCWVLQPSLPQAQSLCTAVGETIA